MSMSNLAKIDLQMCVCLLVLTKAETNGYRLQIHEQIREYTLHNI